MIAKCAAVVISPLVRRCPGGSLAPVASAVKPVCGSRGVCAKRREGKPLPAAPLDIQGGCHWGLLLTLGSSISCVVNRFCPDGKSLKRQQTIYWYNERLERKFLEMPRRYSAWRFTKRRQCLYAGCVPLERAPPVPQLEDGALSLGTVLIPPRSDAQPRQQVTRTAEPSTCHCAGTHLQPRCRSRAGRLSAVMCGGRGNSGFNRIRSYVWSSQSNSSALLENQVI